MPEEMPEHMPEDMPDRMPEHMPEDMPDRMPEEMSDRMPEDMPDRMPEDLQDRMPEDMPERMPEDMPDRMPEDMPDRMPEDMPEHMPEDMPDRMPEDMPDRMPEDMPEHMPEDMPERMPEDMSDRMPEDMPDRMPEDLWVTKCINVMVGITRSKVIFFNLSDTFFFDWRPNQLRAAGHTPNTKDSAANCWILLAKVHVHNMAQPFLNLRCLGHWDLSQCCQTPDLDPLMWPSQLLGGNGKLKVALRFCNCSDDDALPFSEKT